MITTAITTRAGTEPPNCDAAAAFTTADGTVGAVLIDGTGHSPGIAAGVQHLAWAGARLAARLDGRSALVTLGQIIADPAEETSGPAVAAVAHPDGEVVVHWIGDCRAYAWTGEHLVQLTTDHTMGECLRVNAAGGPLPEYRAHDNWVLGTLSRALPTTIFEATIERPDLVVLTTDGIHDTVPHAGLETLVSLRRGNPQALARALVAAAAPDADGYRDDATAIVLAVTAEKG